MSQEKTEVFEIIKKLISFKSVSKDSNLNLIEYVSNYLKSYNISSIIQYDDNKNKGNLLASIGPIEKNGIILAGHTDVVPIEDQLWSNDPFTAWIEDNRLYGRGSSDMKSFIGVILALIPHIVKLPLKIPIHLFLTFDEEVGCHGARHLISQFKQMHLPSQLACIVGEPTEMNVMNAQKGIHLLKTSVFGKSGHSSDPRNGKNALILMSKIVLFLEKLANEYKNQDKLSELNFDIPYNTITPTILKSGTAVNIIPEKAELFWEYRYIPESSAPKILEQFKNYCSKLQLEEPDNNKCTITTDEIVLVPALASSLNKNLTNYMLNLTSTEKPLQANFCTEAGLYQDLIAVPTIICGPGSINQAHKPNEYIEISQINLALKIFQKLADSLTLDAYQNINIT